MSLYKGGYHVSFRLSPKNVKYADMVESIMFKNGATRVKQQERRERIIFRDYTMKDGELIDLLINGLFNSKKNGKAAENALHQFAGG